MSLFDDRIRNYAVEPAIKAGAAAAAVILVAVLLRVPRPPSVRADTAFIGTFFLVFLPYTTWRIIQRARNPSRYRAAEPLVPLDEDSREWWRVTTVGVLSGVLVVLGLWLAAR